MGWGKSWFVRFQFGVGSDTNRRTCNSDRPKHLVAPSGRGLTSFNS
jgi:hypothetical protein